MAPTQRQASGPRVSLHLAGARLDDAVRELARQHAVSVLVGDEVAERRVTLSIADRPLSEIWDHLGRLAGVEPINDGDVIIFGAARPTDRVTLVRRYRAASHEEVGRVLQVLGATSVDVVPFPDGVVVCAGESSVVRRVASVLDEFEAAERPQWVVQFHLVTLSRSAQKELGLDITPSFSLAVTQAYPQSVSPIRADAALRAVLAASSTRTDSRVVAQPLFLALDGEQVTFSRQTKIPVRQRTVTQTGQVIDSGVTYLQAGTKITAKLREMSATGARLSAELELSDVLREETDGLPRTDQRTFQSAAKVESGGAYLLGAFERNANESARGTWFKAGTSSGSAEEVLQIWARVQSLNDHRFEPLASGRDQLQTDF